MAEGISASLIHANEAESPLTAFVSMYFRHRDEGRLLELSEYLKLFPGDESAIAREYLALTSGSAQVRDGSTPPGEPELIGPYRILGILGRGGQGLVYRAQDTRLPRRVALKVLSGAGMSKEGIRRFQREAEIAARLDHPGICLVHDAGLDRGSAWIAMRLVEGETLASMIASAKEATDSEGCVTIRIDSTSNDSGTGDVHPRSDRDPATERGYRSVTLLVEKAARALHVAHETGVIHRDIKPGNIMVTPEGDPVILDFGLAREEESDLASLTQTGDLFGTPAYLSPEQVTRQSIRVDRRTDIWSLGVTLYECLALRRPFHGPTRESLYQAILTKDPLAIRTLNRSIPEDLQVVLATALEKDRDRRYQTALDFAEDLRRALSFEPIHARPVNQWTRIIRWYQRNLAFSCAITAACLFLIAGAATSLVFAFEARGAAEEASSERANVLRLSAYHDLIELRDDAQKLWPPVPDLIPHYERWLARADRLIATLHPDPVTGTPGHYAQLKALRNSALPRSEADLAADRHSHPRFPALNMLESRLLAQRRAQEVREGMELEKNCDLGPNSLPSDADEIGRMAWALVMPNRMEYGRERQGLEVARRALAAERVDDRIKLECTLAWALFVNGLDNEALATADHVLASVEARDKAGFQQFFRPLRQAVAECEGGGGRRLIAELEGEIDALKAEISKRRIWTFASGKDSWWHSQLESLVAALEELAHPRTGLARGTSPVWGWGIEKRLDFARNVTARSLDEPAAAWAEVASRMTNNPRYASPMVKPQLGLVPLGPDPRTNLEEFAHLATGDVPVRDGANELVIGEGTGLVFVLLPGRSFKMGAQAIDPDGINFDPGASREESPIETVELRSFFISKFEMTQGQWLRLQGENPSKYQTGMGIINLLHPVEQVSWETCAYVLKRVGLDLPTEAQWEYACRAGTSTPWWTGRDRETLRGAVNIADRAAARDRMRWSALADWPEFDDGFGVHAPVGRYRPNAFGLHDMHGNVWEWCRDWYYETPGRRLREGDGLREGPPASNRTKRGGSFNDTAGNCRSAGRDWHEPGFTIRNLGIRPAREVGQ